MATDYRIVITVDPSRAQAGARAAGRSLEQVEKRANSLGLSLRRAFAGAGLALAINGIVKVADAYTTIGNRLRTVTSSTEQLGAVQQELFEIAQRTRQGFGEVAEMYARTAASAKDLGVSQRQVLEFTESLNQAIALSGAGALEASAAMRQLSQALSSGLLRNEELNTILEQLPVVADIIAKSMGVARGELRRLAEQGRITTMVLVEAVARARGELAGRFAETIPTISSAFTQVGNSISRLINLFNDLSGSSSTIIPWFQSISKALDSIKREDVVDFLVDSLLPIVELLTTAFKALAKAAASIGALTLQVGFQDATLALLGVQKGLLQSSVDARRRARGEEAAGAPGGGLDQAGAARAAAATRDALKRVDLMQQVNRELQREYELLGLNRDQQEVLTQLYSIQEKFIRNKTQLSNAETEAIRRQLEQLQQLKKIMGVVEDATTSVFSSMENALVEFVKTGKFSFKELADSIVADLIRIALRAFVTNQLISAITGWAGGMVAPGANPLPAGHAQARFATGGSFMVPGSGGTDSRMVAFRATPGERVSISRPDQGGSATSGKAPVQQVNVYNNARGTEVETRERTSGGMSVTDVIISTVKKGINKGEFDAEMGGSYRVGRGVKRR